MSVFRLGREREALAARGEEYRSTVTEYLKSKGYFIDAESSVEGSFEDVICFSSGLSKVCVECKATTLSLTSSPFIGPLCRYFSEFVRSPRNQKFRTLFFISNLDDMDDFKSVFHHHKSESIKALRERCSQYVKSEPKLALKNAVINPGTRTEEEFEEFVCSVDVYEGDISDLEYAVRSRGSKAATRSATMYLLGLSTSSQAIRSASLADEVNESLMGDLFEVSHIPDTIYGSLHETTHREKKDFEITEARLVKNKSIVRGSVRYSFSEPFINNHQAASLVPFNEESPDWLKDSDKRYWLQDLLNQEIFSFASRMGLHQGSDTHRFIFVPERQNAVSMTWSPSGKKKKREVVQKRVGRDGRIFFAHRAVDIGFVLLGNRLLLNLDTNWEFTEDGRKFLPPKISQTLRKEWRLRERNRSRFLDLIFWSKYLSNSHALIRIKTGNDYIEIRSDPLSFSIEAGILEDQIDVDRLISMPSIYSLEEEREGQTLSENPLEPWLKSDDIDRGDSTGL
jgi:hypothetical protein